MVIVVSYHCEFKVKYVHMCIVDVCKYVVMPFSSELSILLSVSLTLREQAMQGEHFNTCQFVVVVV